jgi:hypothetical protein
MRETRQSGFDEREQETGPGQTGLRGRGESQVAHPPGGYSHCACSRLYSLFDSLTTPDGFLQYEHPKHPPDKEYRDDGSRDVNVASGWRVTGNSEVNF